jgi:hypothetical protein
MWCTLDTAKGVRRLDFTEGGFCLLFGRIGSHVSKCITVLGKGTWNSFFPLFAPPFFRIFVETLYWWQ